jgi:hypothetical protein
MHGESFLQANGLKYTFFHYDLLLNWRAIVGIYKFNADELSKIIIDAIENSEGDFDLTELKLAIKIAYSKIVSNSIELSKEFVESLKIE